MEYQKDDNFVLQVNGQSMIDDHIQDGDYIIVKNTKIACNGDVVVAIINNEATLKRYYLKHGKIELHPKNPDFNVIYVKSSDQFAINGILLAVIRKYEL